MTAVNKKEAELENQVSQLKTELREDKTELHDEVMHERDTVSRQVAELVGPVVRKLVHAMTAVNRREKTVEQRVSLLSSLAQNAAPASTIGTTVQTAPSPPATAVRLARSSTPDAAQPAGSKQEAARPAAPAEKPAAQLVAQPVAQPAAAQPAPQPQPPAQAS